MPNPTAPSDRFADFAGSRVLLSPPAAVYADGRPGTAYRLEAADHGPVLLHGDGADGCDILGARDVWVFEHLGVFYMHYDGAGRRGWLACLAVSTDLIHWEKKGPILDFGPPGSDDSASASYGTTFFDGRVWHMFYMGTPNAWPAPEFVPAFPYNTLKATGQSPVGPWTKQTAVVPFRQKQGSYYDATASPGQIVEHDGQYLMFFSASTDLPICLRTLAMARTDDLNGPWEIAPEPIVPATEQVENSSLYFEPANQTWFLFTNHIGIKDGVEFTDAIWAYWSMDLLSWNPSDKAVVLDGSNCRWSKTCIGLPSVVKVGDRLAILYDAPAGAGTSHMNRDIGLAWLDLPLHPPLSSADGSDQ
jgi:predicted GH43/DUF377 family glycosyl hydrolase